MVYVSSVFSFYFWNFFNFSSLFKLKILSNLVSLWDKLVHSVIKTIHYSLSVHPSVKVLMKHTNVFKIYYVDIVELANLHMWNASSYKKNAQYKKQNCTNALKQFCSQITRPSRLHLPFTRKLPLRTAKNSAIVLAMLANLYFSLYK